MNMVRLKILVLSISVALIFAVLLSSCGTSKTDCTAPAGSTIMINPSAKTWNLPTGSTVMPKDIEDDWTVTIFYADGTPMPNACGTVSGALAKPSPYDAYEFQYYAASVIPNVSVDSGFTFQTDRYGQYTFSTKIPGGTGTFTDAIYVKSGTNVVSAGYNIQ